MISVRPDKGDYLLGILTSYECSVSVETKWRFRGKELTSYGRESEDGCQHSSNGVFDVGTHTLSAVREDLSDKLTIWDQNTY
jgi:hypothetical protein